MQISTVSAHNPAPDDVKVIWLGRVGAACLTIGPLDIFGDPDDLRSVCQTALDQLADLDTEVSQ